MSEKLDSFLTLSASRHQPSLFWAALVVVVMHIALLGFGKHWNPAPPKPKERQKVIVQTIRLEPSRSPSAQIRAAPLSPPPAAPAMPASPPKPMPAAEIPKPIEKLPQEEVALKDEIPLPKEETVPKQEPKIEKEEIPAPKEEAAPVPPPAAPKPPPPAVKKETKPQTKPAAPKPAVKETKQPAAKKAAPVKKPAETAKKSNKPETPKSKPNPEADKKKQQEKADADKKRQQEQAEADKKKQQEKAEADKKRQKEQAEAEVKRQQEAAAEKKRQQEAAAEKKRQQEIAAAEEAARLKEQALISKAKENLAKMGETRDKISTSPSISLEATALPKELGTLQVDALPVDGPGGSGGDWGTKEVSYSGEVASRLKKALRLPDYGAVKIKMTLDRTGKVVKVEIVQSESSKNKAYVESKIPTLLFPPFGQRFKDVPQNTFEITLQNDS